MKYELYICIPSKVKERKQFLIFPKFKRHNSVKNHQTKTKFNPNLYLSIVSLFLERYSLITAALCAYKLSNMIYARQSLHEVRFIPMDICSPCESCRTSQIHVHVPVPLLFASQRKVLVINLISCTCNLCFT